MGQAKRRGTFEQRLATATPKPATVHSHKPKLDMSPEAVNWRYGQSTRNHCPGVEHRVRGAIYRVSRSGAWLRMTPRETKANRRAAALAA